MNNLLLSYYAPFHIPGIFFIFSSWNPQGFSDRELNCGKFNAADLKEVKECKKE